MGKKKNLSQDIKKCMRNCSYFQAAVVKMRIWRTWNSTFGSLEIPKCGNGDNNGKMKIKKNKTISHQCALQMVTTCVRDNGIGNSTPYKWITQQEMRTNENNSVTALLHECGRTERKSCVCAANRTETLKAFGIQHRKPNFLPSNVLPSPASSKSEHHGQLECANSGLRVSYNRCVQK